MLRVLKDCYDKKGNRYKIISFDGSRYACQSYLTNNIHYFLPNDIVSRYVPRETTNFLQMINNKTPEKKIMKNEPTKASSHVSIAIKPVVEERDDFAVDEPEYEEPEYDVPQYDYSSVSETEKLAVPQDNVKETAEDDFYADL